MALTDTDTVLKAIYAAGFRGETLVQAVGIATRESSLDPTQHRTNRDPRHGVGDRGLFQINYTHDGSLKQQGYIKSYTDLFNPYTNARVAMLLYRFQGNSWAPAWGNDGTKWSATGNPMNGVDLEAARALVRDAERRGVFAGSHTEQPPPADDSDGGLPWWQEIGVVGGNIIRNPFAVGADAGTEIFFGSDIGQGFTETVAKVADPLALFKQLFTWDLWRRILLVVGGGIIVFMGLAYMMKGPAMDLASVTPIGKAVS